MGAFDWSTIFLCTHFSVYFLWDTGKSAVNWLLGTVLLIVRFSERKKEKNFVMG